MTNSNKISDTYWLKRKYDIKKIKKIIESKTVSPLQHMKKYNNQQKMVLINITNVTYGFIDV